MQPGSSAIPDRFFYKESKPEHASALTDLGFAKLQKNQYPEAKQYFEQALHIDPQNPYAAINLGVVYEREGNLEEAKKMYEQVLSFDQAGLSDEERAQNSYEALKKLARENIRHLQSVSTEQ